MATVAFEAVSRTIGIMGMDRAARRRKLDGAGLFSLIFGMAVTLIVSGYQFGRGNHTVYLLDGLRELNPELFTRDWFVTQTLQYHAVFSLLTATCMRLHILEPVFLIGYLELVVLWHFAWRGIVHAIGGDDRTYILSVVLYYLSAAGISIGVFQFLQDACFLPSNVSNIAVLVGLYEWMRDRRLAAGIWFGIAGLFHVNFAAMVIGLWVVLVAWQRWVDGRTLRDRRLWIATVILFVPSLINLGMAVPDELRHGGTMPMGQFVNVYVRFRHAHHFDPIHWPIGLWLSFLWPIPFAIWAWMKSERTHERQEAARIFAIISGLLIAAFLFAGIWFINEPFVQLCLFRFSIYVKLLSCIGAACWISTRVGANVTAWLLMIVTLVAVIGLSIFVAEHNRLNGLVVNAAWDHRVALALFIAMIALASVDQSLANAGDLRRALQWLTTFSLPVLMAALWGRLGVGMTPEPEDPMYRQVCTWARNSTPVNAIFLTPPQETDFRLYGQRAIVVNFKHVPQLSGEILQWRTRLLDVLGLHDLHELPQDYTRTMAALGQIYDRRPAEALVSVARQYDAGFIVIDHPLDSPELALSFHVSGNPFFVYAIRHLTPQI
ncbi:MAG: hypothetical protein JO353_00225 [Phycisphaerae bacterium]|nr:hypothetical protein [Phycisphaerae bacterium]